MDNRTPPTGTEDRRHLRVAAACGLFVAFMVGAAYAAVPLYDMFCRVTGFGGTPRVAQSVPENASERTVRVMFDANVTPGLPWTFTPETRSVNVRLGETKMVLYRVTNTSNEDTWGTATYNVTPEIAGAYFAKLECFCFTTQHLGPGESMEMPVVFFVDPDLDRDPDARRVPVITLSYTFYSQDVPVPAARAPGSKEPVKPL